MIKNKYKFTLCVSFTLILTFLFFRVYEKNRKLEAAC